MKQKKSILNYFLAIAALLTISNSFAQESKIFNSILSARRKPENVYKLRPSEIDLKYRLKYITEFKNLEYLDLSFYELTEIPEIIFECKNLKYLD